jgi:hypothetical protein
LKEIDINGDYTYSKTITVNFTNILSLQAYPNPTHSTVTIHLPLVQTSSSLSLYDASGKQVLSKQLNNSTKIQQLDISGLSSGVYNLIWKNGQLQQSIKLVKN